MKSKLRGMAVSLFSCSESEVKSCNRDTNSSGNDESSLRERLSVVSEGGKCGIQSGWMKQNESILESESRVEDKTLDAPGTWLPKVAVVVMAEEVGGDPTSDAVEDTGSTDVGVDDDDDGDRSDTSAAS